MHKIVPFSSNRLLGMLTLLWLLTLGAAASERLIIIPKWDRFEASFKSKKNYEKPLQDCSLAVLFTSPSGESRTVFGFWDGGPTWKVRFSPNEVGTWIFTTVCSDKKNPSLDNQNGSFLCTAATGKNRFSQHGPVRVSSNGHYLMHEDGTPFFWMADTAWNGPLLSSRDDWWFYAETRKRQGFSAVQWVTTQWRASPGGNGFHQLAFTGKESIQLNAGFFQELDGKVEALDKAGLLNVPVLLWAFGGGSNPKINPGLNLPESQAILLARYMVARWGANNVAWILAGDGDYRGPNAAKWIRIGRAVFGNTEHAPVTLHPNGMAWILDEFKNEHWFDFLGYQSGHGDSDTTLRWLFDGPPAKTWQTEPPHPFINLEPPYEYHISYQAKTRITPEQVRRAVYWSLLVAPTAGVSYGGHGVWGWDDGTKPPADHESTGIPFPWRKALTMPAAEEMRYVASLFNSVRFWRLRPAQDILAKQSGAESAKKQIAAARTLEGDQIVIYTPEEPRIELIGNAVRKESQAYWFNPRTGEYSKAAGESAGKNVGFTAPGAGDWVLVVRDR